MKPGQSPSRTRIRRGGFREILAVLRGFRGNARACLLCEPFWGIPYNLYAPYASIYMLSLGCSSLQVGIIASVNMALSVLFSLVSGWVTDRLGRRRTSVIFDLISWSVPVLLWALAGGFRWFLAAAVVNSMSKIVQTSWTCLFVEDTEPGERVHVYTWLSVASIAVGLFAPFAGLVVGAFGLVPAVRGLYLFAFVSMTSMFLIRNVLTKETRIGRIKMAESRHHGLGGVLADYRRSFFLLFHSPLALIALGVSVLANIQGVLRSTFQSILLVNGLKLSQSSIAVFPAVSSVVMLIVFLFLMPALARKGLKVPLLWGLAASGAGALILSLAPEGGMAAAVGGIVVGAFGMAVTQPMIDAFLANSIPAEDRAKVMSIVYLVLYALAAPFGYVGGLLTGISERLPFVFSAVSYLGSIALVLALPREKA